MLSLVDIGVLTKNLARKVKINKVPLVKCTDEYFLPKTPIKSIVTPHKTPDFLIKPCEVANKQLRTKVAAKDTRTKLQDSDNKSIFNEFNFKRISPEFFDLLRKHEGIKIKPRFKKTKRSDHICVEETFNANSLENTHPNLAAHMVQTMENAAITNDIYDINFYDKSKRRRAYKQSHLDLNYILYLMDHLRSGVRKLSADEIDDIKWFLSNENGIEPTILADILRSLNISYPDDPYFAQYLNQVIERLRQIGTQYFGFNRKPQYDTDSRNKYSIPGSSRKSTTELRRKINFADMPSTMNQLEKRIIYPFKPVLFHEPFARDRIETWHAHSSSARNLLDSFTEKEVVLGPSRSYLLDFAPYDKRPSYAGALQSRTSVAYDPSLLSYRHSISPEHKTVSQFLLRYSDSPYGSQKHSHTTPK